MKDILGKEIAVGQTIAWPSRRGSNTYLHAGTVEQVHDVSISVRNHDGKQLQIGAHVGEALRAVVVG